MTFSLSITRTISRDDYALSRINLLILQISSATNENKQTNNTQQHQEHQLITRKISTKQHEKRSRKLPLGSV